MPELNSERQKLRVRQKTTLPFESVPPTTFFSSSCYLKQLRPSSQSVADSVYHLTDQPGARWRLFIMSPLIKSDVVRKMHCLFVVFFRRNRVEAEGLPGLHPVAEVEWEDVGSGGASEDHTRSPPQMPRPLQQLRAPVSEPGPVPRQA